MRKIHCALAVAIALVSGAGVACAHSELVANSPPSNAVLTQAPKEIRLSFSESIEARFSHISLTGSDRGALKLAHPVSDPQRPRDLAIELPTLAPGKYEVHWQATSADSHRIKGNYSFQFRP